MNQTVYRTLSKQLQKDIPNLEVYFDALLAPYSTVKIGGPADLLLVTKSSSQLLSAVQTIREHQLPLTILGWGANTLISDKGIRGVTIINKSTRMEILTQDSFQVNKLHLPSRWKVEQPHDSLFNYYSGNEEVVLIEVDSGTPLPYAITNSFLLGLTGLEWFSRIPASIGGAIYNNVHGENHYISDHIYSVTCLTELGEVHTYQQDQLNFAYDYSLFHTNHDVILSAQLLLYKGDVKKAKQAAIQWAQSKSHQPQNSLGCVFQNLSAEEAERLGLPTTSAGYVIDKVLDLAGTAVGGAQVSTKHAAFIENAGSASASDYLALIKKIQKSAKERLRTTLRCEIFFLGFDPEELVEIDR